MTAVREFIFSLMVISISCAAVNMLTSDNSSVSKYVHFLVALIVTAVLLSPMQSVLDILPKLVTEDFNIDIATGEADVMTYAEAIIKETCENIEEEVALQIEDRFSVTPSDVTVYCDSADIENIIIEKIVVAYDMGNRLLFSDTVKYIEGIMGCECEVIDVREADQ